METLLESLPWLLAMVVLIGCSAFFSASEAALFSLRPGDRHTLRTGGRSERTAAALLSDPERLLTAVLFWNLVINVTYFAITSIVGLKLESDPHIGKTAAIGFTITALVAIILLSEMLPKSLGVVSAKSLTRFVGLLLAGTVRTVDPLMPLLQLANLLSRRLLWPRFKPEQYLEVTDLERAIELTSDNAHLVDQEQTVLHNIVGLSEIRVDESMRPRVQFRSFRPPIMLSDLEGELPPSGYLLITQPDSDTVVAAIPLTRLSELPSGHLEHLAEPVIYVPWFSTVADALQQMKSGEREVAAVVNEFGETIGILTFEDVLDTIFTLDPTRSARLLNRRAIREITPGTWHVTGMTSLRRLGRVLGVELPECKSVTVAGITQEVLERLPVQGDEFDWGPFQVCVIEAPERGRMAVQLSWRTLEITN